MVHACHAHMAVFLAKTVIYVINAFKDFCTEVLVFSTAQMDGLVY